MQLVACLGEQDFSCLDSELLARLLFVPAGRRIVSSRGWAVTQRLWSLEAGTFPLGQSVFYSVLASS